MKTGSGLTSVGSLFFFENFLSCYFASIFKYGKDNLFSC